MPQNCPLTDREMSRRVKAIAETVSTQIEWQIFIDHVRVNKRVAQPDNERNRNERSHSRNRQY